MTHKNEDGDIIITQCLYILMEYPSGIIIFTSRHLGFGGIPSGTSRVCLAIRNNAADGRQFLRLRRNAE
jgi:hypothetical protein